MLQRFMLIIILCLPVSLFAAGKIYTWTDDDGLVHYADRPPAELEATEVEIKGKKKDPVSVVEANLSGVWYGTTAKGGNVKLTFNENGTISYIQTRADQSVYNYQGIWTLADTSITVITEFSQTAPAKGDFKRDIEPLELVYNIMSFGDDKMELVIGDERFSVNRNTL